MPRIMGPGAAGSKTVIFAKAVPVEKIIVHENPAAKPIRPPSPAVTTPDSKPSEVSSDGNAGQKTESHPESRVNQWRVKTDQWRTPYISGIVNGNVNDLRVNRLNGD